MKMSIMDLFRPKWKNSNLVVRMNAVKELNDKTILSEIANNDEHPDVRKVAHTKLEELKRENDKGAEKIVSTVLNQPSQGKSGNIGWRIGHGDGQKVGTMSVIKETQQGIVQVIMGTNKGFDEDNIGVVNLVVTPNHDITDFITDELIGNGVDPLKVGFHSLNRMHEQLLAALSDQLLKNALLHEIQNDHFKDVLTSADISSSLSKLEYKDLSTLLLEVLRLRVMKGDLRYVVADAFLLGGDWDVGEMNAPDTIEKLRGSDQKEKIKVILWLVNMDRMTENQVKESVAILDSYGDRRFHSSVYDKTMVQITSIESAKNNKNLQDAANIKGGWSIDLLLEYLPEATPVNK